MEIPQKILGVALKNIKAHNDKYSQLHRCLDEYPKALEGVLQWQREALQNIEDQFDGEPFDSILFDYDENVKPLIKDEDDLMELLRKYSFGKITKLKYLKTYAREEHGAVLESMADFIENIETDIITPLTERLDSMQELLLTYYIEALEHATSFERYLKPNTFYNSAKVSLNCLVLIRGI